MKKKKPSSSYLYFLVRLHYEFTSTLKAPCYTGLALWQPSMWHLIPLPGRMKPLLCKLQPGVWKNVADCSLYWGKQLSMCCAFFCQNWKFWSRRRKQETSCLLATERYKCKNTISSIHNTFMSLVSSEVTQTAIIKFK